MKLFYVDEGMHEQIFNYILIATNSQALDKVEKWGC